MEMIIALLAILSVVLVIVGRIVKCKRTKIRYDLKMKLSFCILLVTVLAIGLDLLASGSCMMLEMIALDFLPSALTLWILSSSLFDIGVMKWGLKIALLLEVSVLVYQIYRIVMGIEMPPSGPVRIIASLIVLFHILLFVFGLADRMRDVKALLRDWTVWALVCISVDMVYLCSVIVGIALVNSRLAGLGVLMLGGVNAAAGMRSLADSYFVIWKKQENLIVESMKLMSVQQTSDTSHVEDVYKELYDRIVTYFEVNKPYLDSDLTINDLVKDLYSNKLYISKAISQFTGRNFCQFVNYYRIMHSIECFRANPEMRVYELATMNGFNSPVSYNMAFRLFMGETPSEWFRKEKSRLLKKGK